MKTLILDGSYPNDALSFQINSALNKELKARGWDSETILLCEQKIGNCAGDFFCWVRNPGICNINDDNRLIAAKIMHSDLLIYLTPVTFGGYSSNLKRMVDHQIQNVLPFFTKVGDEIHHQKRYKKYPRLLVIGWMDAPDMRAEAVFRHLVRRNAINMHADTTVCGILIGNEPEGQLAVKIENWLKDSAEGRSSPEITLPEKEMSKLEARPIQQAILLVGSPRTRKSTSAALGGYMMEQLAARGVKTETFQIHTSLNSPIRMNLMLESIDTADLVILAFPLYVDSLPAPVIAALEKIAIHRRGSMIHKRFAAIVNCGFPEAAHTATALAICETFARQAGFTWVGSLALGGGEGLIHGIGLKELDGRAISIKKSLEMAADALADGNSIPKEAMDLMTKPVIPNWLYLLTGAYGWNQAARRYKVKKLLKNQPYGIIVEGE